MRSCGVASHLFCIMAYDYFNMEDATAPIPATYIAKKFSERDTTSPPGTINTAFGDDGVWQLWQF